MPTETRHICFDLSEVCAALLNLRRRCGRPSPAGEIMHPTIEQDAANGNIRFTMQVACESGVLTKVEAGQAELGTALIHFCRQEKIPLPLRANKLVGIVNGYLALICVRERKDYLPLDNPFSGIIDTIATDCTGPAAGASGAESAVSLGDLSRNGQRRPNARLEKVRLRLRERAASKPSI